MRSAHRALGLLGIGLPAIAVGLAFALAPGDDAGAGAGARTLTRESFYYVDQSDGRVTAEVRFEVVADGDRHRLAGAISAVGPTIEPAPGFEGVRGANRITAEKLSELLSAGAEVRTRRLDPPRGSRATDGALRAARFGTIPMRKLLFDGAVDLHAQSGAEYLLELAVTSGALDDGSFVTELWVAGSARMRVEHSCVGGSTRIDRFESLEPASDAADQPQHSMASAAQATGRSEPAVPPAEPPQGEQAPPGDDEPVYPRRTYENTIFADWHELDLEAKWVRYRAQTEARPDYTNAFISEFEERCEWELLEWIAIADLERVAARRATDALMRLEAPNWVRCGFWCLDEARTTGTSSSKGKTSLLEKRAPLVLAWMEEYPATQQGAGARLYAKMSKKTADRDGASELLPPLDPAVILAALDPPAELRDFGDAKQAQPGVTYLHQVERAMSALVLGNLREEPWLDKLHKLTRHANERIRCAALLTYSRFESRHIPSLELKSLAKDEKQPLNVRRAAFLAYSYHKHPEVSLDLYRTARLPSDPLWSFAVSRVVDFGDPFTLKWLQQVDVSAFDEAARHTFARQLRGLQNLTEAGRPWRPAPEWLAQIAWAELKKDPLADPLKDWFLPFARQHSKDYRESLEAIAGVEGERLLDEWDLGADRDAILARMRELARALLTEEPVAPKDKGQ